MSGITRRTLVKAAGGLGVVGAWGRHPLFAVEPPAPDRLAGLDDYAENALARWSVPGLAIAVVQDGKLIHARGYGVRSVGEEASVDAETIFHIASTTKTFTAAAIAKLIDNGKLQWDDPISKHLPAFRLSDPELTAKVTIRQALSHRTGLPTANMLWRSGAFSGDEVLARLRFLRPVAAPGEKHIYNNNMYLVLGKVIERISGKKWDEFLRDELFQPLGMKSTTAGCAGVAGLQKLATPHVSKGGEVRRIKVYCPGAIAPAGAIYSNVLDMAQWLKLHLGGGVRDGRQILSRARLEEMHTAPRQLERREAADPRAPRVSSENYGLGWFFNDQGGRQLVEHSGHGNGFVSWVSMIPRERLGLVILSNRHNTGLNVALRIWIVDMLLGRAPRDWSERLRPGFDKALKEIRDAKAKYAASRPAKAAPPRPLSQYAGRYTSPLYGDVVIAERESRLSLQFGTRFEGELQHWEKDTFRAFFLNPHLDDWLVTFKIQESRVTGLQVKESPWAPPYYNDADDLGEFIAAEAAGAEKEK